MEDRRHYITPDERDKLGKAIVNVKFDLKEIYNKVEQIQIEHKALKADKDYETILLNSDRWSAICYDFKNKYLDRDYVLGYLAKQTDSILKEITSKTDLCSMCM